MCQTTTTTSARPVSGSENSPSDEVDLMKDAAPKPTRLDDADLELGSNGPALNDELDGRIQSEASLRDTVSDKPPIDERLTRRDKFNLTFALLAWACTICNLTLIVGTSNVVMLSIGGSTDISTLPLGSFFLGASLVSALITPWIFQQWGRQWGFLSGIGLGLMGTVLGAASVVRAAPALLIVACAFFGMATGIGFYLRFAAVEVVPAFFSARAMTLVVSGGCIAAFAGPEAARATRYSFGEDLEYLGVFVMTGVFNICNAVFTALVHFPTVAKTTGDDADDNEATTTTRTNKRQELWKLLAQRRFLVPLLMSSLTWTIMIMPMSVLRVAMGQVGYSSRQTLTTIELHFLGMYAPGFVTGRFLQAVGHVKVCGTAILTFATALVFLLLAESEEQGSIAIWIVGMVLLGIGWNLGFNSASMWTSQLCDTAPTFKSWIQAANDFVMFGFTGAWIVSASYIYEAGGGGLEGWVVLNYVVVGLLGVMTLILVANRGMSSGSEAECPACSNDNDVR